MVELRMGQLGLALADFRRAGVDPMPMLLAVCGVLLALAGVFGAVRWWGRAPRSV